MLHPALDAPVTGGPAARAALRRVLRARPAARLLAQFADERGVSVAALRSASRAHPLVHHRQEAYAFIRANRPDLSLAAVGRLFGDRDKATILSGTRAALARGYVPPLAFEMQGGER